MFFHALGRTLIVVLWLLSSVVLSAGSCGGGGGDDDPAPAPVVAAGGSAAPPTTMVTLAATYVPQTTAVWCWAAVTTEVLNYFRVPGDQCQLVSLWITNGGNNFFCCPLAVVGPCLTTGTADVIRQSLFVLGGLNSSLRMGPLSFAEVKSEIDAGRPIVVGYQGSFSGHVVLVIGYDSSSQELAIHDPFYGPFVVPYASTFVYKGNLVWNLSIFNIDL